MRKHLAIFSPEAVTQIFSGQKTVETRFSKHKIAPFGAIAVGDLVYIKPSGKDIAGQFIVKKVIFFQGLDQEDWEGIDKAYGKKLTLGTDQLDKVYFSSKQKARFGTIIFIGSVEHFIASPIKITKKDQRGWVVLD